MIMVWEADFGREIVRLPHNKPVISVAIDPADSSVVAGGSDDGPVRVWNIAKGKEVIRIGRNERVHRLLFSPDGRYIAIAGDNGGEVYPATTTGLIAQACGRIRDAGYSLTQPKSCPDPEVVQDAMPRSLTSAQPIFCQAITSL